jgi:hypothetical protein
MWVTVAGITAAHAVGMHPYRTATERLLHRWFVQYNPLYIASAVFVLVGITLMNKGLATDPSLWAMLAPRMVSELYALALIAAAAILIRRDLRRPAWFVAMFAVLHQADLTLGTETYALLKLGVLASAIWFALFVFKLHALVRALRLEPSPAARLLPIAGAFALAVVPHLHRRLGAHALSVVVATFAFALAESAVFRNRSVDASAAQSAWYATVMRRSLRATWAIWGVLAIAHLMFWIVQYRLEPVFFLPLAVLFARRWLRERPIVVTYAGAALVVLLAKLGIVRAPQSTLSWGVSTVAAGFALLLLGMVTSLRAERA